MFRFISLIFTLIYAYFLLYSMAALDIAFKDKQGVETILYHGIYTLIWVIAISAQFLAVFSGSEIYVTAQNFEEKEENS